MFLLSFLKRNLSHDSEIFCILPTLGLLLALDMMGLFFYSPV